MVVVTDDDCINYITDKLLWSWTDQVAYTELTTGVGNEKFVVTNLPKEFDKDTGHEDCMKELTINFVNKKTVDCEIAGDNDYQGKSDASMSDDRTREQSKLGGTFSPTEQNDQMSGLLDAVTAALKGRAAGDDSRAGQEATEPPGGGEPTGEQT